MRWFAYDLSDHPRESTHRQHQHINKYLLYEYDLENDLSSDRQSFAAAI